MIDCNMQLTESLENGRSSELLVWKTPANGIYILIGLFKNSSTTLVEVNQIEWAQNTFISILKKLNTWSQNRASFKLYLLETENSIDQGNKYLYT